MLGAFKKETAQIILDVVRYLRESGFVIDQPGRGKQFVPPDAPIYVRNDSGEEIPPFACMQTTGAVDVGGQNYITVDKPVDDTGEAGKYLFNSIAPIESGGYGIGYAGPLVRMLTDGSTVNCGDSWQPDVGQWEVTPGGSQFTAAGEDDIETDVMRAFVNGSSGSGGGWIKGKLISLRTASAGIPKEAPYTGLKIAEIHIETTSCDLTALIDEEVDVVDWMECVFDHDEADLLDVWVIAKREIGKSQDPEAEPGTLTPCHWSTDDRCCVPADFVTE